MSATTTPLTKADVVRHQRVGGPVNPHSYTGRLEATALGLFTELERLKGLLYAWALDTNPELSAQDAEAILRWESGDRVTVSLDDLAAELGVETER